MARWEALDELFRVDVPRFVSFSTTYQTMDRDEIREALSGSVTVDPGVVFHEPLYPRGENFDMCLESTREAGYNHVAEKLEDSSTMGSGSSTQLSISSSYERLPRSNPIGTTSTPGLIES